MREEGSQVGREICPSKLDKRMASQQMLSRGVGNVGSQDPWQRKCEIQVKLRKSELRMMGRDTDLLELLDGTLVDTTTLVDQMSGLWR